MIYIITILASYDVVGNPNFIYKALLNRSNIVKIHLSYDRKI